MTDKNALVFFSFRNHRHGYIESLFARLSGRAARHAISLSRGSLKDLRISVIDNQLQVTEALTGRDLADFSLIYFELWYKAQQQGLAAALYAKRRDIPFFSEELLGVMPTTKVGEIAVLADQGIPLPQTITSSNRELKKLFKSSKTRPLAFPVIVKAADGYGGKNNYLVRDYAQLAQILHEHKDLTFIVQGFIPNDCDYRCLVLGGEIKLVLKRARTGDTHLNNTSMGAEGKVIPVESLPETARADVVKAAKALGRTEFAGVDLIINNRTGQHFILEVNQTPQIEIGAEVDQKMDALLQYMASRSKERSNG